MVYIKNIWYLLVGYSIVVRMLCQYNCEKSTKQDVDSPFPAIPNWCATRNPFSGHPQNFFFNVSSTGSGNSYRCMSGDLFAECESVSDLAGIEFESYQGSTSRKYLVFLLTTGRILYSDYENDELRVLGDVEVSPDIDLCMNGSICRLSILKTGDRMAVVLVVLQNKVFYYTLDYEISGSPKLEYCFQEDYINKVVNVRVVRGFGKYHAVVLYKDSSSPNLYGADFVEFNGLCVGKPPIVYSWTIKTSEDSTHLGFDIYTHEVHLNHSVSSLFMKNAARKRNVIFILYDDFQVKIFPYKLENLDLDFSNSQMMTFYEGEGIVHVNLITYEFRRVDFLASSCGNYVETESQPVSIVVNSINEPHKTEVRIVELIELHMKTFEGDQEVMNYADRDVYCKNGYWDQDKCVARAVQFAEIEGEYRLSKNVFTSSVLLTNNDEDRYLDVSDLCSLYLKDPVERDVIKECILYVEDDYECDLEKLKQNDNIRRMVFSNLLYASVFVAGERNVEVFSYGYEVDEFGYYFDIPFRYFLKPSSVIQAEGRIKVIDVSRNSFYFFVSISRQVWEVQSREKMVEMCDTLSSEEKTIQLTAMAYSDLTDSKTKALAASLLAKQQRCRDEPPLPISFNDFTQFVSACPDGIHCPSLFQSVADVPKDGKYSLKPFYERFCESGSFCQSGIKYDCPSGFRCYEEGLKIPVLCESDDSRFQTCLSEIELKKFSSGILLSIEKDNDSEELRSHLEGEHLCPEGSICTSKYARPIPVPPRYKQELPITIDPNNLNKTALLIELMIKIHSGEEIYNNFTGCNRSEYCPVETAFTIPLASGQYCEDGECIIPEVCPAGSFCKYPDEKEVCFAGKFCPNGSITPKSCSLLSICPSGSKKNGNNFLTIVLIIFLLFCVYATYFIFRKLESIFQKRRVIYKPKIEQLQESTLSSNRDRFRVNLGFSDLTLALKSNGKKVVNKVCGYLEAGSVTAVMGLSGCGKTSIITTLAGKAFYGNTSGEIYVNGIKESLNKLKKIVGFVPQEDVMYRDMTVYETLYFSCRTRCTNLKNSEVKATVNETIMCLGLSDIRNQKIGDENVRGISGGQRKRVNIGIELVSDPIVLFLDEPTSGLDSMSSQEVCDCLQEIAKRGINILTVIHQPRYEIFSRFDNLVLLAQGGLVIYSGPLSEVEKYFESHGFVCPPKINPADFYLDCCAGKVADKDGVMRDQEYFVKFWEENKKEETIIKIEQSLKKDAGEDKTMRKELSRQMKLRRKSIFVQFFESLKRSIIMRFRNMKGFLLDNVLIIIGGFILGFLFAQYSISPSKFFKQSSMITLMLGLCAVMGSLTTFGERRAVFIRETDSGLISLTHFFSLNLVDMINILFGPFVFCCIFFFLASPFGNSWLYFLILVAFHFTTYGLGYMLSILFGSNSRIASIVVLIVLNLLTGLVDAPYLMERNWGPVLAKARYGSFVFFATEALFIAEVIFFGDNKLFFDGILKSMDEKLLYKINDIFYCIPVIVGYGILFRLVAYILLVSTPPDSMWNQFKSFVEKVISLIKTKLRNLCVSCVKKKRSSNAKDDLTLENASIQAPLLTEETIQIEESKV